LSAAAIFANPPRITGRERRARGHPDELASGSGAIWHFHASHAVQLELSHDTHQRPRQATGRPASGSFRCGLDLG
jgi:hypothetical protein